jgi:putative oxidoreductase
MKSIDQTNKQTFVAAPAVVGRVLLSLIFVVSGFGKLAAPAATKAYMAAMSVPLIDLAYVGAVAVELGVGLALLLGYRTRIAGLILAVFSVVTGLIFHSNFGDQNQMIHFMKNLAMAGGMLQVAAYGSEYFSIDALLNKTAVRSISGSKARA